MVEPLRTNELMTLSAFYKEEDLICILNIYDEHRKLKKGESFLCEVTQADLIKEEVQQGVNTLGDAPAKVKRTIT